MPEQTAPTEQTETEQAVMSQPAIKPEESEHSLETLLASIWSRRESGIRLPTDANLTRPITRADIEYLCNYNYPYLQIMNTAASFEEEVLPEFVSLPNGWILLDYKDAMSSSYSTKYSFQKSDIETIPLVAATEVEQMEEGVEDERGEEAVGAKEEVTSGEEESYESDSEEEAKEEGGGENGEEGEGGDGSGTIIKQQFDTALAMILEAKNKGWAAIEIIAGSTLMQFYAWVVAKELGITLHGFTPTEEQERHYKLMEKEKLVAREEEREYKVILNTR